MESDHMRHQINEIIYALHYWGILQYTISIQINIKLAPHK